MHDGTGDAVVAGEGSLDDTIKEMGLSEGDEKKLRKAIKSEGGRSRRTSGEELEKKYSHMVKGSLRWDEAANKQKATIRCTHPGCTEQREVYSSDLFQVKVCVTHKKEARKAAKQEQAALLKRFKEQQKAKGEAAPAAEESEAEVEEQVGAEE